MKISDARALGLRKALRSAERKIEAALTVYHEGGSSDEMAAALGYVTKCEQCKHPDYEHNFFEGQCFHPDKRTQDGACTCGRFVGLQLPS
jgi:hypothetical protein